MKHYYIKYLILILSITLLSPNSYADFWEGKVNGDSLIITYKGIIKNGKLNKAFRLSHYNLCVYGNTNFPKSPPKYNFYKGITKSWNSTWEKAFYYADTVGFGKRCNEVWKGFISKATINSKNIEKTKKSSSRIEKKSTTSDLSHLSNKIICKKVIEFSSIAKGSSYEGYEQSFNIYNKEAKRRGLACKERLADFNKSLKTYSDYKICNLATNKNAVTSGRNWIRSSFADVAAYINEARKRGLNCTNKNVFKELLLADKLKRYKRNTNFSKISDQQICFQATSGNSGDWSTSDLFFPYVAEAKYRNLTCGVKSEKENKIRIAKEKAEQEKIRKKAEAEALKEKKAKEEKFRKENIARIKKEAKKREAENKLKKEIKAYKEEANYFYQDITDFVKSGYEIDLVKLTKLFSKRPKVDKKWNNKDVKSYKNLKSYLNNNQAFVDFEKNKKKARTAKANADKNNTIISLNNNLKKLNELLRENFGNDKVIKIIQSNIKKTKSFLDGNFNQKKANKVLSDVNEYLSNYFDNKNKLKELNNYLNNKKLALTDILKNNFGTEKATTASKLISDIEKTKTVASKKQLKDKIDIFIKNPSKGMKNIKKINKENELKHKFSDMMDNQICNKAVRDNKWILVEKDLIAEAKRRGLDCGIKTSSKSKIGNLKNKVVNYVNKNLKDCSNISGGWGKTKCMAMLKMLPIKFVCLGIKSFDNYDGKAEINIKNHKEILFNISNVFFTSKPKIFDNNLLSNGTFSIGIEYQNIFKNKISRKEIKFKISAFEILYEQQNDGEFMHDGYCKKRL